MILMLLYTSSIIVLDRKMIFRWIRNDKKYHEQQQEKYLK